jgi:predicted membrane channel-forming protein YqfA (hemolysin III family)
MKRQTWQKICNIICYWAPILLAILAITALILPVALIKSVILPMIMGIAIITFLASTFYDALQNSVDGLADLAEKISPEAKVAIEKAIEVMRIADPTPAQ